MRAKKSRLSVGAKSSTKSKVLTKDAPLAKHPRLSTGRVIGGLALLGLFFIFAYIFYWRFPDNYQQPNFYAEDGREFINNILVNGFWHAIGTTFNGYYIWGLYLLDQIAMIVDKLLYGGRFADIPRSISLVSYGFLSLMALLPIILFRGYLRTSALLLIVAFTLFVPMRGSDYAIIGVLGNFKFAFIYIAFLLLIYRHLLPKASKKVYLVDLGLLLCAYTNITVYVMLPFALIRYWPDIKQLGVVKGLKNLLRTDRSLQSLVVLGLATLPQLYIVKRDGVPTLAGYLDTPFNMHHFVEIFFSRSFLYDVLFPINKHLNDTAVVILLLAFIGIGWRFAGKYRKIFIFGLLTIFGSTLLFVINRTGISDSFVGYKNGGPDQFFYPQNWIFGFIFSIVAAEVIARFKPTLRFLAYLVIFLGVIFVIIPRSNEHGLNTFMEKDIGNIYSVGKRDCAEPGSKFNVAIYPTKDWYVYGVSRQQLCTPNVINYQPQVVSLGLTPFQNDYYQLSDTPIFTQTFVSPANNLNGLEVYFSTFGKSIRSPYTLKILEPNCRTVVKDVSINSRALSDNSYSDILFPAIKDSAGKKYCFTVTANISPADPLAIQLSAPDIYPSGQTTIKGKSQSKDVVFRLHYK